MDFLRRHWTSLLACAFLLAFYWRGLDCWFYQDDFGWLHLGPAKSVGDFFHIVFAPKAHGNIRPWSENLFFYGLRSLFGVNPLPFKIVVFLTCGANVILLGGLVRRLTNSAMASFGAQIFWLANPAVPAVLCWTCLYNQVQCLFFVLLALLLFVDERYKASAVVFALGLGSLELIVVLPLIATLYSLLYDRKRLRRTIPLYVISAAFIVLHFAVAPAPKTGPYAIQLDGRIFTTLGAYLQLVLGPERFAHFHWNWPAWTAPAGTALMGAGLLLCAWLARRAGAFGLGMLLLLLAPVLVLPDHIMDYLVTGPAAGLAIVLGSALVRWRRALPVCVLYLAACLPASWEVMTWNHDRSLIARDLVQGVLGVAKANPGRTLLLTGMDTDQFLAGYADLPFELHGLYNIFLLPGAEKNIHDASGIAPLYVLKPEKAWPLLRSGQAMVLDVAGGKVRDVTADWAASGGASRE